MVLAVHPRCGEELLVYAGHGPDAVWAETVDGRLTIVPTAWTDLRPRPPALQWHGQPVRLAPAALQALAAWVAARAQPRPAAPEPVDGEIRQAQKVASAERGSGGADGDDRQVRAGTGTRERGRRGGVPAALVGEARPSAGDGRGRGGSGGRG